MRAQVLGAERAVEADRQRLRVRSEYQNASAVWPDSVRPEASVMVPEIITGRRAAACLEHFVDREQRGLGVERVEDGLDHQHVGAAVDQAVGGFAVGLGAVRRSWCCGSRGR